MNTRHAALALFAVLTWHTVALASPRCQPDSDALEREQMQAEEYNARAIEAALRQQGLEHVALPTQVIGQQVQEPGVVIKGDDGASYIVAGHSESSGEAAPSLMLVEDKNHWLYIVDLAPQPISEKKVRVCGCGDVGGGARMPQTIGYKLPKDRSLHGHVRVGYKSKRVVIEWTRRMPDGSLCQGRP